MLQKVAVALILNDFNFWKQLLPLRHLWDCSYGRVYVFPNIEYLQH